MAALRDMETLQPWAEMQGLLEVVAGAEAAVPRNGKHGENGKLDSGKPDNGKHENGKEGDRARKKDVGLVTPRSFIRVGRRGVRASRRRRDCRFPGTRPVVVPRNDISPEALDGAFEDETRRTRYFARSSRLSALRD